MAVGFSSVTDVTIPVYQLEPVGRRASVRHPAPPVRVTLQVPAVMIASAIFPRVKGPKLRSDMGFRGLPASSVRARSAAPRPSAPTFAALLRPTFFTAVVRASARPIGLSRPWPGARRLRLIAGTRNSWFAGMGATIFVRGPACSEFVSSSAGKPPFKAVLGGSDRFLDS
jgi:hypothetical protein